MDNRMLDILKHKPRIGVFGLGSSNLAVLDYLAKSKLSFSLTVRSDDTILNFPSFPVSRILTGSSAYLDIDEDILFLSPSVRRDSPPLIRASKKGVILSSDTELFLIKNKRPLYAVTGSDGKSTTSYLLSKMLTEAGIPALPAGNFGAPLSAFIDKSELPAAELSSFQLMYAEPSSERAIITNITPNHLDYHRDMDEYIQAKLNIAKRTQGLIIDFDSELLRRSVSDISIYTAISSKHSYSELKSLTHAENFVTLCGEDVMLNGREFFSLKYARRKEGYNIKNYMLAASALIGKAKREHIEAVINSFEGLAHRCETVLRKDGITYIDSSIDTTPDRTLATLKTLSGDVAVIIGGRSKALPLGKLAKELPRLTVGACLIGEVGEELSELLPKSQYKITHAKCMAEAVSQTSKLLSCGGTVILSPAATSFDKYKNYKERGEDFKKTVLNKTKDP